MPAKRTKRRGFGSVRALPSGRFQARYRGPDGRMYSAPVTFTTVGDADAFLATIFTDIVRDTWRAPRASGFTVDQYGRRWIELRPGIKDSTRARYGEVWDLYVGPRIGDHALEDLSADAVRDWHRTLGRDLAQRAAKDPKRRGNGSATVALAYRVLRAVMATAAEDSLIESSPCRIKGGGTHHNEERPTLTGPQVEELAAAVPDRYTALVLVLAYGALRLGEATELRRKDVNLEAGTLSVSRAVTRVQGALAVGTPKSKAGKRIVALPASVAEAVRVHMAEFAVPGADGLVFPTRSGRCAYGAAQTAITRALRGMGLDTVRVHDVRHTGATLAAANGASVADLMNRLGHASANASLRYIHATDEHGRGVADRLEAHRAEVIRLRPAQ